MPATWASSSTPVPVQAEPGGSVRGWRAETAGLPTFLLRLESISLVGVASPGLGCLSPRLTVPRGWACLLRSFLSGLS